jgi:flagellar hook-associated protein 1 FlgK
MAQLINSFGNLLHKQQSDANLEISILVDQINNIGMQIVSLNQKILNHEMDGSHANDLHDQRARLVDELSDLVNVEARELDLGTDLNPHRKHYIVMINGYDFINHYAINTLGVVPRQSGDEHNYMDVGGLFDLEFTNNNVEFDIYHPRLKGQLKGLIDIRDGNGASANALQPTIDYKGIPYYMEKMNRFVRNLGMAIDQGRYLDGATISTSTPIQGITGHAQGYDLNGEQLGTLMFTYEGGPSEIDLATMDNFYDNMNCLNFVANPVLLNDPRRINCAADPLQGESAYAVTIGFSSIFNDPSLFREGRITDFVTALNSGLGIDARQASNFEASYRDMTTAIDNQRINVSGVDLNEEMVNMIKNQQLYQASAKLVSTINSIYDLLINRLGA